MAGITDTHAEHLCEGHARLGRAAGRAAARGCAFVRSPHPGADNRLHSFKERLVLSNHFTALKFTVSTQTQTALSRGAHGPTRSDGRQRPCPRMWPAAEPTRETTTLRGPPVYPYRRSGETAVGGHTVCDTAEYETPGSVPPNDGSGTRGASACLTGTLNLSPERASSDGRGGQSAVAALGAGGSDPACGSAARSRRLSPLGSPAHLSGQAGPHRPGPSGSRPPLSAARAPRRGAYFFV